MQCRWCDHKLDDPSLVLSDMPLTDQFMRSEDIGNEFIEDIEICKCKNCGLIQNPNNFHFSEYYEEYTYSSGHSSFVKSFMNEIASYVVSAYFQSFGKSPRNVLEVGSGDGAQLSAFKQLGLEVLGVEPSEKLQRTANDNGIKTLKAYFDEESINNGYFSDLYDINFSSYTLDHIPNPKKFLENIWCISSLDSLLIFEIHDVSKIIERGEWCLFEHEHMIYTGITHWEDHLNEIGFEILFVNPLTEEKVRANSLIVVAKKIEKKPSKRLSCAGSKIELNRKEINSCKQRVEHFIDSTDTRIIGWGIGGRGIMTAALLSNYSRICAFFDSNAPGTDLFTPKTNIPIKTIGELENYTDATVLVFSFGYFNEIRETLMGYGFCDDQIVSLKSFYS